MQKFAANQLLNKRALVAGTRLVNFQASASTYLSADLLRPQIELPGKLGRASAIYLNKISVVPLYMITDHRISWLMGSTKTRMCKPQITLSCLMYVEAHSLTIISQLLKSVCHCPKVIPIGSFQCSNLH